MAGGEHRSVGCYHHSANGAVVRNCVERFGERADQSFRQRIATRRTVKRECGDAISIVAEEGLFIHAKTMGQSWPPVNHAPSHQSPGLLPTRA